MAFQLDIENKRIIVPEDGDPCELWMSYYGQLQKAVGSSKARVLWLVSWSSNGSAGCTTSPTFIRWMQKNKIDVSNAATRAIADASAIGSNFMGLGKNMSKVLSLAVPISLGVALVMLIRVLWNTSKKADLSQIAALTPQGKGAAVALKMLKK